MSLFRVIWQNAQNYVNPMGKLLVLLLALYPFVWYMALRNHSMIHAYMTHRNLAVTVMAVCCAVSLCLEDCKKGENIE